MGFWVKERGSMVWYSSDYLPKEMTLNGGNYTGTNWFVISNKNAKIKPAIAKITEIRHSFRIKIKIL